MSDATTDADSAEALYQPVADAEPATPVTASLRSRTLRGSAWTGGGYALSFLLRFGSNLVLTRLLVPEMFGLVALVNIFMMGLQMFSDVGVGPAIIQNPRGDERRFLDTAWTIQVARGVTLWVCACLLAVPIAQLYHAPMLKWLLPVAGLTALAGGFNSTNVYRLNRHLQLGKLTLLDLSTQIVGITGMIIWALLTRSVWALVVPGVVARLFYMMASHLFLMDGPVNRFGWDRTARTALFHFGKWIFLSTLLTFLANQADRLIYGKMIPLSLLGVYGVAAMFAAVPREVIQKVDLAVAFPAYSRVLDDPARFRRIFARLRTPLILAGAIAVTGLITCGPWMIDVLYDSRWHAASWILPLLAIGSWFQILEATNGCPLLAHGRTWWNAACTGAKFACMLVFLPLGFHLGGFPGAVLGLAASDVVRYLVISVGVARLGLVGTIWSDLLLTAGIAAAAGLITLATRMTPWSHRRPILLLIESAGILALLWLPAALWQWTKIRGTPAAAPAPAAEPAPSAA